MRRRDDGRARRRMGAWARASSARSCWARPRAPRTSCAVDSGTPHARSSRSSPAAVTLEPWRASGLDAHQAGVIGSPRSSAAGARREIHSTCSAGRPPRRRAKPARRRSGRPPCEECASLASRCTSPSRARRAARARRRRPGRTARGSRPSTGSARLAPRARAGVARNRRRRGARDARSPSVRRARRAARRAPAARPRAAGRRLEQNPAAAIERDAPADGRAQAVGGICATSPPCAIRTSIPRRSSSRCSSATRSGNSSMRTSWSSRMWGVAHTTADPVVLGHARHRHAVGEIERAVVERREDVAVQVDEVPAPPLAYPGARLPFLVQRAAPDLALLAAICSQRVWHPPHVWPLRLCGVWQRSSL